MDKLDAFFEPAKNVSLSPEELLACRKHLMQKMQENPVRDVKEACPTEHMTDIDPSLIRSAQTVRLTADEVVRAETTLFSFMKDHPVDMVAAVRKREKAAHPAGLFSFFSFRYSPAFAAILVLVLGTGSLSYAAQSALPGDTLYPVKIHLNEKVHTTLAVTPEAKANWEATRAERRVKEAKKLADNGRLTPETSDTLIVAFNVHIANSHTTIQKIADNGHREQAEAIGKKTEKALRHQITVLQNDTAVAMMRENVQRAADKTVMLDSSIRKEIAMQTLPDAAITMMAASKVREGSSSSNVARIAVNLEASDALRMQKKGTDESTTLRVEGDANITIASDTSINTMQMTAPGQNQKKKESSSISSGSGSSSMKTGTSSAAMQSTSSFDIQVSSKGSPIHVDIKTDGTIDVQIVSPKKTDITY